MSRYRKSVEVSYAVRLNVVFKYLGQLSLIAAVLTCVPGVFAICFGESRLALSYFAAALLPAAAGMVARRLTTPQRIQRNEAFVIAALIFPLSAIIMTGPFMATGLSLEDALFESISGVTTTGLSMLATVEDSPRSLLFARAWQQWYGGLGIVVLSLTLTTHPGVLTRRLGMTESHEEDLVGSTRTHARRVFLVYAAITIGGFGMLWAIGLSWFDALAHALAAVSTGGFSTHDNSLADFPTLWPRLVTVVLAFVCAGPLPVYWRAAGEGWRALARELQFAVMFLAALTATMLLTGFMLQHGAVWHVALRNAAVMAFSAQTTAGFSSTPVAEMDAASKVVLIVSMAIGGASDSTAGGFKVLRLIIMVRLLQTTLLSTALPKHAVHQPHLGGQRLEDRDIQAALLIVVLFGLVVILSWLPFLAAGFDPLDALFEVVSATGTVGLSSGICTHDLPSYLKGVLCVGMLLGRLEFIALLVVVSPRTWFGKRVGTP